MKPILFTLPFLLAMILQAPIARAAQAEWPEYYASPMQLDVTHIDIQAVPSPADRFKQEGNEILGGRQATPGTLIEDAYTKPVGGTMESYSFAGDTATTIDHTIIYCDDSGNFPHPACFAFAWQPCGNGLIFPPLPILMGTTFDGASLSVTIPFSGCFFLTFGVDGFAPGHYAWMVLGDYTGACPVDPFSPDTDTFGGSRTTMALYDGTGDVVGEGFSSARPWCFELTP